jgi:3D (Asp-Asp-Asp) domain-containing protein
MVDYSMEDWTLPKSAHAVRELSAEIDTRDDVPWVEVARRAMSLAAFCSMLVLVVWSAVLAKSTNQALPLAAIRFTPIPKDIANGANPPAAEIAQTRPSPVEPSDDAESVPLAEPSSNAANAAAILPVSAPKANSVAKARKASSRNVWAHDPEVRWFNGRPAKPAETVTMRVTAYSPDSRSCGKSADGITATLHSVQTNASRLVAADPSFLPYGSMVSIDGYDDGRIVPVLDCGGAIKGHHLDVLFPTHEQAKAWGSRHIKVVVWKYIDGKPAENPRAVR